MRMDEKPHSVVSRIVPMAISLYLVHKEVHYMLLYLYKELSSCLTYYTYFVIVFNCIHKLKQFLSIETKISTQRLLLFFSGYYFLSSVKA